MRQAAPTSLVEWALRRLEPVADQPHVVQQRHAGAILLVRCRAVAAEAHPPRPHLRPRSR
eukprot:scaffold102664_cov32-Tisochrysis_lutea.AAC.3